MASVPKHYDQATIYELQKWLENLYADEQVCPQIQPGEHDIECLLKLKARNEEAEKNTREVIHTNKYLIKSYNTKSDEIEKLLESENISLSDETIEHIESLAAFARRLNLEEPDETNFLLAICDLKTNQIKKQLEKAKHCATLSSLSQKVIKTQKQNEAFKKDLKVLEEIVDIQDSQHAKIRDLLSTTTKKISNYDNKSKIYEDLLKEKGFDSSIRHNNLVKMDEELNKLEKECDQLKGELDSYKYLPPNLCLAEFEMNVKREELLKLEGEVQLVIEALENIGRHE